MAKYSAVKDVQFISPQEKEIQTLVDNACDQIKRHEEKVKKERNRGPEPKPNLSDWRHAPDNPFVRIAGYKEMIADVKLSTLVKTHVLADELPRDRRNLMFDYAIDRLAPEMKEKEVAVAKKDGLTDQFKMMSQESGVREREQEPGSAPQRRAIQSLFIDGSHDETKTKDSDKEVAVRQPFKSVFIGEGKRQPFYSAFLDAPVQEESKEQGSLETPQKSDNDKEREDR